MSTEQPAIKNEQRITDRRHRRRGGRFPFRLGSLFTIRYSLFPFFALIVLHGSLLTAYAQRDYFTPEEVEMIRDAQQLDMRVDLLVKILDRRLAGLGVNAGAAKIKDPDKWGTQPAARGELLLDVKQILQKAIDDVDNVASHPDALVYDPADPDKKPKSFSTVFPKAVHKLADAAARWKPALEAQLTGTKDEKERGSLLDSIEMCDDIIASVAKLASMPKPAKK
jgi:hypothetical protein